MWTEIGRTAGRPINKLSNTSVRRDPFVVSGEYSRSPYVSAGDACERSNSNPANQPGYTDSLSRYA
jgi:hypothetical protein